MFQRYTENARRVLFVAREEASGAASACIEAEHLLLGIIVACEDELNEGLRLKDLEGALRAHLATPQRDITPRHGDMPLANQSKRILAYAAEEAERLNSRGIGSGHLLLGILRESESVASHFLVAHYLDLPKSRQMIAMLPESHVDDAGQSRHLRIGRANSAKRRYWVGIVGQAALLILLGVGVAESSLSGRHLLMIAAIWFVAAVAWSKLGASSFFFGLGRNRAIAMSVAYTFGWLYQLFMFGWLFPLVVGVYRVTVG